uniref:Condensin complex subunit 1 n=1 Tax=Parastrongyloides trichosuri TaxID=131310 RepID=A0A0N4ZRG4_PARTI
MENISTVEVQNEQWVNLYRACFENPQVMKKNILILHKRRDEIADAAKILSIDEMLKSIDSIDFLSKPEGVKIAAKFYHFIGPNIFKKRFGSAILKLKSESLYDRYASLLISTFTSVRNSVKDCSEEEQERQIDLFVAIVASKFFELAAFCEDSVAQKKFMLLFKAVCEKSREASKSGNTALKNLMINNAQLLIHKGTIEFLWIDYTFREKMNRLNICMMLTYMFPVNFKLKIDSFDDETCFYRQVTMLKKFMTDSFVPIRSFLAKEFLGVLGRGWFQLDNDDIKEFISLFMDRLANEKVGNVRAKIYDGLHELSGYPFTKSLIRKLIVLKIPMILHDSEKCVRMSGMNCLNYLYEDKILTDEMINISQFVLALDLEKDMDVARRIVRLLVLPFFSPFLSDRKETLTTYLDKFKEHFTNNRYANYMFHKWIQSDNYVDIKVIIKHTRNLIAFSMSLLDRNLAKRSSIPQLGPYEASQMESQHSENLEVIRTFMEAAAILYKKARKQLIDLGKADAVSAIDSLVMKFYRTVKENYFNSEIYKVALTIANYTGNSIVKDEADKMFNSLKNFRTPKDRICEYLNICIEYKQMEIMEIILQGTDILNDERKLKNNIENFERTIDYCSKLLYSTKNRNIVMKEWNFYVKQWSANLERILPIFELRCQSNSDENCTINSLLIIRCLKLKFIISIMLDEYQDKMDNAGNRDNINFSNYGAWEFWKKFSCIIETYYKNTSFSNEDDGKFKEEVFKFGLETFKMLCCSYKFNKECVRLTGNWLNTVYNINGPISILILLLKLYPDAIDAMYHGPDLFNSIRDILHRFLVDLRPWITECLSDEDESTQKTHNEINRLWQVIQNKFESLAFINIGRI